MPFVIVRNDITKMQVDAIVNAAKESLLGGGGVDGCIHRAAGPGLLAECKTLGGCATGDAKITGAYQLPCKYVIHTVGPVWHGGNHGEREKLVSCYRRSLALAKEHKCETVAFPLISSGVFGYPKDQALRVAVDTISEFLMENDMTVYIVIFSRGALQISGKLFSDITEYIDDNYVEAHRDSYQERMRRIQQIEQVKGIALADSADYTAAVPMAAPAPMARKASKCNLDDWLSNLDTGFTETLLSLIKKSGRKNSDIYKKANISKQHFSKLINDPYAKPSKQTAIALALALELNLEDTRDLIGRAGYALTNSSTFDLIIQYFIEHKQYNVIEINIALYEFDQTLLGA